MIKLKQFNFKFESKVKKLISFANKEHPEIKHWSFINNIWNDGSFSLNLYHTLNNLKIKRTGYRRLHYTYNSETDKFFFELREYVPLYKDKRVVEYASKLLKKKREQKD